MNIAEIRQRVKNPSEILSTVATQTACLRRSTQVPRSFSYDIMVEYKLLSHGIELLDPWVCL